MSGGTYLLVIVLLLVFATLIAGVVLMATGGARNQRYGNRLMAARVGLQALAVLLLACLLI